MLTTKQSLPHFTVIIIIALLLIFDVYIASAEPTQVQMTIDDYSKAINLDPHNAAAYVKRARACQELGQYQNVVDDCSQAIILDPTNADAYSLRASAYQKLGQRQKAIDDCNKAISVCKERIKKGEDRIATLTRFIHHVT